MSPYVATLSVSPSLPCECLRSAAVLRRSAAVPPRFGDGTADFGDGVRRVWRRLAWRLARLTANRRGPRRYRRGRDARASRSVAKYGETSAAARRPDRFGANLHGAGFTFTRGRRKRSGQKRSVRQATTEVLRCPQRAYSGARRSATVGDASGGGARQYRGAIPRPLLATTSGCEEGPRTLDGQSRATRALSLCAVRLLQRPQLATFLVAHTNGRAGASYGACIGQRLE